MSLLLLQVAPIFRMAYLGKAVKKYIAEKSATLPDGIRMDVWIDLPKYLEGSLNRMENNIISGALLVFVVLSLFLRMKVAFWVIVGKRLWEGLLNGVAGTFLIVITRLG